MPSVNYSPQLIVLVSCDIEQALVAGSPLGGLGAHTLTAAGLEILTVEERRFLARYVTTQDPAERPQGTRAWTLEVERLDSWPHIVAAIRREMARPTETTKIMREAGSSTRIRPEAALARVEDAKLRDRLFVEVRGSLWLLQRLSICTRAEGFGVPLHELDNSHSEGELTAAADNLRAFGYAVYVYELVPASEGRPTKPARLCITAAGEMLYTLNLDRGADQ